MKRLASRGDKRLTASKLQNAADVVQDYLTELSNIGRPAARIGRPANAAVQDGSKNAVISVTEDAGAAALARGRVRPRQFGNIAKKPNAAGAG